MLSVNVCQLGNGERITREKTVPKSDIPRGNTNLADYALLKGKQARINFQQNK